MFESIISFAITIGVFILVLTILVLVHELGHFLVAKRLGIKVEEFGFGFPPRVIGKKVGETIYSINLLPVGGFVKLFGEDNAGGGSIQQKDATPVGEISRAFFARPLWQRMAVVVAGVVMNFILAIVLISFLFTTQGVAVPTQKVIVSEIQANSPAQKAGLMVKDHVVSFNEKKLTSSEEFVTQAQKYKGQEVTLVIERQGKMLPVKVTPRTKYPKGEGPMGLALTSSEIKKYSILEAPYYATIEAVNKAQMIFIGLGSLGPLLFTSITHLQAPVGVMGPVGVAQLTGEVLHFGQLNAIIDMMILLSLSLAVINILPIPALDGGRFFFLLVEFVIRKKLKPEHEATINAIGLITLLGLLLFFTYFDIARWIGGKSILP